MKDPKLDELVEATRRLGYKPEGELSKHPKRMWTQSGYVSVEKKPQLKKGRVISDVAKLLSNVRGEKSAAEAARTEQKPGSKQKKH